jgi:Cation transport protein
LCATGGASLARSIAGLPCPVGTVVVFVGGDGWFLIPVIAAVVLLATATIFAATLAILSMPEFPLEKVLFETVAAFATVGLSTGITVSLPPGGQLIIAALMFLGRVSTITVASAFALRGHTTVLIVSGTSHEGERFAGSR